MELFFCACAVADAAIAALCIILYSHSQHEGGEEREWGKIKKCALGHCQGRERAEKNHKIYIKKCGRGESIFKVNVWIEKGEIFVMMMMKADDGDEKLFSSHFASLRIFFLYLLNDFTTTCHVWVGFDEFLI